MLRPHDAPRSAEAIVDRRYSVEQVVAREISVAVDTIAVVGARLDGDRDGLLVFFVCIILLCVAAAVYFLTHLLVAAAPVVMLASGVTIARLKYI